MKNEKGFYDMHQPMSKTQPGKPGGHKANYNGDGHDFNIKGKVTNPGSSYHGYSEGFNGAEKQSGLDYLKNRNLQGQEVRNYSATWDTGKSKRQNDGQTIYNGQPIKEVYTPADDKGPDNKAVVRPTITRKEAAK